MTSDISVKFGEILDKPKIFPDEKGKVNVVITNQGSTAVNGPIDLKLFASTDKVLDKNNLNTLGAERGANDPLKGTDELLGTLKNQNISLAAGESKTITIDFAGSAFRTASVVAPGAYYLIAEVKPGRGVSDSNKSNNVSSELINDGDVVIQWNAVLLNAIEATGKGSGGGTAPPRAARNQALVHAAIYDAVNAIARTNKPYLVNIPAGETSGASKEAAAVEAAYQTLVGLFPGQKAAFDTQRTKSLAAIPDGQAETKGIAIGKRVAQEILAKLKDEGIGSGSSYTPGNNAGNFQLIPPEFQPDSPSPGAVLPKWGLIKPLGIKNTADFRPEGPPEFSSPLYGREIERTRQLGAKNNTSATTITRTTDQTEIAQFWAYDRKDTFRPPGQWNQIAQEVALSKGNTLEQNARLFALLNIAQADAGVVAWDTKYTYDQLRPITAIRNADTDNNPLTKVDKNWEGLLATPNFPDYISGHSVFAGASAAVLARFFGTDNVSFNIPSQELPGVARSYRSFSQAAQEDAESRVYGGIHVDLATVDGVSVGKNVGNFVVNNLLG